MVVRQPAVREEVHRNEVSPAAQRGAPRVEVFCAVSPSGACALARGRSSSMRAAAHAIACRSAAYASLDVGMREAESSSYEHVHGPPRSHPLQQYAETARRRGVSFTSHVRQRGAVPSRVSMASP